MNKKQIFAGIFLLAAVSAFALDFDALSETVKNKDLTAFKRLMRESGAVSATNGDGFTPIQWIAGGAPVEFVQYLASIGADINAPVAGKEGSYNEFNEYTPLLIAAWGNNIEVVKYLESSGADINYKTPTSQNTAMDLACMEGSLDVVKYLFDRIPNKSMSGAISHLAWAINHTGWAQEQVAIFLIENGVDLDADASGGYGATHFAVTGGKPKVLKMLLDRNVDWERTTQWGETPLMVAASSSVNATRALIGKKVRIDLYSLYDHLNALEKAVTAGNQYTVQLLLDAGAKATTSNPETKKNAIQLAQSLKFDFLVPILQGKKRVAMPTWTLDDEATTGITFNYASNGELELVGLDGKKSKLSSYKGKVVLLNIWATWCGPCVSEMPSLQQLYDSYKNKNLVVLGQSVDDKASDATKFAKDNKLTFPLFIADFAFTNGGDSKYPSSGIPTTYIIDKNGFVVETLVGSRDWSSPDMKRFLDMLLGM